MSDEELLYLFYERAAIMEFDGGLTQEEAERKARIEIYGVVEMEVKP